MNAVQPHLLAAIKTLQSFPSTKDASLGGGTNLALRYNHRISIDIDLFFPDIIGKSGFSKIVEDTLNHYGDKAVQGINYPCDIDDQFIFLRFFLFLDAGSIKVEIMQNMHAHDAADELSGLRLLSERDIGMLKLMSAANRYSKKDIYDLDYLTDRISLLDLINSLKIKQEHFNKEADKNIFDLDNEKSPVEYPELLLEFDAPLQSKDSRPTHSHHRIDIVNGSKNWNQARSSWRRKVRELFRNIGKPFPTILGF